MKQRIARRRILQGLGGLCVALPWLESSQQRQAHAADGEAKRFILFFQNGGTIGERWQLNTGTTELQLGEVLAPLERHKSELIVVQGLDMSVCDKGPGDHHMRGMGACATGHPLLDGSVAGSGGGAAGLAAGPSIDQAVAAMLGGETPFKSLALGVYSQLGHGPGDGGGAWSYCSYSAPNVGVAPEDNPMVTYQRLFGGGVGQEGQQEAERRMLERRSVNDAVIESYNSLLPRVSARDRVRLEEHLAHIRDLENRLTNIVALDCGTPAAPSVDHTNRELFPEIMDVQMDLMVLALACGQTNVALLQNGRGASTQSYGFIDQGGDHHGYQHADDGSAGFESQAQICRWYSERFALLLDKLKLVPEGEGTLLDNSLVYWTNDLARGNTHGLSDMSFVLAGRAGGSVHPGKYLRANGIPHNQLLAACYNAVGGDVEGFGDADFSGVLPGII